MLLGAVFKAIGQADVPLFTWSEAKRRYYLDDLNRWAAFWRDRYPNTRFATEMQKRADLEDARREFGDDFVNDPDRQRFLRSHGIL